MTSEIRTNSLKSRAGMSTVTMTDSGPMFSGITTFVDNSGFTFGVGGGTSIFTPATNVLTFGTNNTEKIRIDANGNTNITGVCTATHFYGDGSNLTGITGTTINNNADNRVITGSGTANTLNGESGLTYDGSTLVTSALEVGINNNSNTIVEIGKGATGNKYSIIDFIGDTTYTDYGCRIGRANGGANTLSFIDHRGTGDLLMQVRDAGAFSVQTTSLERLRITSDGKFLFNNTSVTATNGGQFHITNTNVAINSFANNPHSQTFMFAKSRGTSGSGGTAVQDNDFCGHIEWYADDGVDTANQIAKISGRIDGSVGTDVTPGELLFYTTAANANASTERLRITSSGAFGFNTSTIRENIHTHQADSNQNYLRFTNTGTGTGGTDGFNIGITASEEPIVWNFENTNMLFATNNTERLRITSDGRVLIGRDSLTNISSNSALTIQNPTGSSATRFNLVNSGSSHVESTQIFSQNNDLAFIAGTIERLRIKSNGRVAIGGHTPAYLFDVQGASVVAKIKSTNNNNVLALQGNNASHLAYMGTNSSGDFLVAVGSGIITRLNIAASSGRVRLSGVPGVAGSNLANVSIESDGNLCTTTSLREYKTNISSLDDTSWLFNLNPVTFDWKKKTEVDGEIIWEDIPDGNGTQYGLIAEEVEEVKKEFCYYDNDGKLTGVHYDRLISPLIKAVQDLKSEINILQKQQGQIETLIQENISLRARVTNLEGN